MSDWLRMANKARVAPMAMSMMRATVAVAKMPERMRSMPTDKVDNRMMNEEELEREGGMWLSSDEIGVASRVKKSRVRRHSSGVVLRSVLPRNIPMQVAAMFRKME